MLQEFADEDVEFSLDAEDVNVLELEKQAEGAPVVRLVNAILLNAIKKGASDIHVEPYEKKVRVRYRVDGVLLEEMQPPIKLKNAIASRLKIMASLDIAERRLPQDGRIKLKMGKGKEMDFRVSVLPTIWGEKIVLRLLDKGNLQLDMTKLGFDKKPLDDFLWAINQPWGMVLVTGPTGSGKTTTLYSALSDLNKIAHNISTAEDPVEYNLARHQPGADARRDRAQLRRGAALASSGRTRTSSWSARSATSRRPRSRSRPRSRATWCSRRCTPTTRPPPSPASSTWASSPSSSRPASTSCWPSAWRARCCNDCKGPIKIEPQVLADFGFTPEQIARAQLVKGAGCKTCNGSRLQGAHRPLRGDALQRGAQGDGAPGRLHRRAEGRGGAATA